MAKDRPLISIIIPTFNRAHLISKCLDSILLSNSVEIETIIVDDASTDHTKQVINAYHDKFPITYLQNQSNEERSFSRNRGILFASGKYVWIIDSDDFILEGAISTITDFIKKFENETDVFYAHYQISDESSIISKKVMDEDPEIFIDGIFEIKNSVIYNLIIKTDLARKTLFDTQIIANEDLDFNMRLALVTKKFKLINQFLYNNVEHNQRSVHNPKHFEQLVLGHKKLFKKWGQEDIYAKNLSPKQIKVLKDHSLAQLVHTYNRNRNTAKALYTLVITRIQNDPLILTRWRFYRTFTSIVFRFFKPIL